MILIKYISDSELMKENDIPKEPVWNVRQAARAVLLDSQNRIALMHIGKYDVYKLPGGGMDEGETLEQAFIREIKEETGCEAEKIADLGITIEKRDEWKLVQISHCFLARVTKMGEHQMTAEEKEEGFSLHWVESIEEAIRLVGLNSSDRYDDNYIRQRDLAILNRAKAVI